MMKPSAAHVVGGVAALSLFHVFFPGLFSFPSYRRRTYLGGTYHVKNFRSPFVRRSKTSVLSTWSPPVDVPIFDRQVGEDAIKEFWPIVSVVAVWGPNTSELTMIGPHSEVAGNGTRSGSHICEFTDGLITEVQKFSNLELYASATVWVCRIPAHLNERYFSAKNPDTQTCLEASLKTSSGMEVERVQTCHRPGVLPVQQKPYNTAICTGSRLITVVNNTLNSAHIVVPEFLQYHIRHGIDQIVVYVLQGPNYDHEMKLLRPFADAGYVTIVAMGAQIYDLSDDLYGLHVVGNKKNSSVGCQHVIMNDCVNRLKYRAKWVGLLDVDEFVFAEEWYQGKSPPHLPSALGPYFETAKQEWDAVSIPQKRFRKNPGLLQGPYLLSSKREAEWPGVFGKVFVRPERVRVHWVHSPTHCLRGKCITSDLSGLMYYHLRFNPDGEIPPEHQPTALTSDGIFLSEAEAVFEEACAMLRKSNFDCRNKTSLLPPVQLAL